MAETTAGEVVPTTPPPRTDAHTLPPTPRVCAWVARAGDAQRARARDAWRWAASSESRETLSASHGFSELALFYLSDENFFEKVTVLASASREDGVATVSPILPTRHD